MIGNECDDEHECSRCKDLTFNDDLCRQCSIDQAFADCECEECGAVIFNANALLLGYQPFDHEETCVSGREERAKGLALTKEAT